MAQELNLEGPKEISWLDGIQSRSVTLLELRLDSFRSFGPGTVFHFHAPNTNFIIAPNGHGKTTIEQALRFLFRGPYANNLKATAAEKNDFLWDCLPTELHGMAYPEGHVEAVFLVDGKRIEVTRTLKTKRMYPDDGKDLTSTLSVEVDEVCQGKPESALEEWFGSSVLLDYHIFDAEETRVRFTGHSADNRQAIRGDNSSYSVQKCLQEFIGLDIVTSLIGDLAKIIREVSTDLTSSTALGVEWTEFRNSLEDARNAEDEANQNLENCRQDICNLQEELNELLDKLGEAESAAELVAIERSLKGEHERLVTQRDTILEQIRDASPWLHIILARDKLRAIGGRNSGDEARRIINFILENAPIEESVSIRRWLEDFRQEQVGEPGAIELIGRVGWGNIEHAVDSVQSIRVPSLWHRLSKLREAESEIQSKFDELAILWTKLPEDYDKGTKEVLGSMGVRKVELETTISNFQEIEAELSTALIIAQERLGEVSSSAPRGADDEDESAILNEELLRLQDLKSVMETFQTEVTLELRLMVENVASEIFQNMMRKDGLGLAIDENFRFHMVDASTGRYLPLPSAGEETIAVLAFLSALQEVTGLGLPFIIDSALHRLDLHHQSRILSHFVGMQRQAVVFLTEKDWESFSEDDQKAVLSQVLVAIHPPGSKERIELMDSAEKVEHFSGLYANGGGE